MKWMICVMLFAGQLCAVVLDGSYDLKKLEGKKMGYYIGSFDPFHNGHRHFVEKALSEKHVDYVLIYPNPGGDAHKNRSPLDVRQVFLTGLFGSYSRVLTTSWSPKELQEQFQDRNIEIVGMVGSDFITEQMMGPDPVLAEKYERVFMRGLKLDPKHYEDTIGALMALKASSFLVSCRGDVDLSHLNGYIYDRSIAAQIDSSDVSSTQVRQAVRDRQPFEHMLSFLVQGIIKEMGLYGHPPALINWELKKEIDEMFQKDQELAFQWSKDWNEASGKQFSELAKEHNTRLKGIVKEHGWPGASLVGLSSACHMWLLVQHQDHDISFQKTCLKLMKEAVDHYEAAFGNYAYLLDRVRKNEGLPQLYGTQWEVEGGKYRLYLVEDVENLENRRREAGMVMMEDYKLAMKKAFNLTEENFQ